MAFDSIKGLFSKAEVTKQPEDALATLSAEQRNTLNVLRDALQTNGDLTSKQIEALAFVQYALSETVGEVAMEEAIAKYLNEKPESRLSELQEAVSRNSFLKLALMKSLAEGDEAAIQRAKSALRVLSPDTFTTADVEAYCQELLQSEAYQAFIISRVGNASAADVVIGQSEQVAYTTGVAPQRPSLQEKTPSHPPAGTKNIAWTPPTANDTLHTPPPSHMKK
jgi:hypothetical protein